MTEQIDIRDKEERAVGYRDDIKVSIQRSWKCDGATDRSSIPG